MPSLVRDAQIIVRVTAEATSRTRIQRDLRSLMVDIRDMIEGDYLNAPYQGGEILSYDIYISGDPQLGHGSKAHLRGVKGGA